MTPIITRALYGFNTATEADAKLEALIDDFARKAVEATVDHVLQDWLCYDDETKEEHRAYNEAHRAHLIEGGLERLNAAILADEKD
jgi:hypothetical protein